MTENTKEAIRAGGPDGVGNHTDGSAEAIQGPTERQDAYVVFSNEKDLRHHEAIRIKASLYTGIALRVKIISPGAMENLLYAIDLDSGAAARQAAVAQAPKPGDQGQNPVPEEFGETGASAAALVPAGGRASIVNLRFEDCKFTRKAAAILSEWLKSKAQIETISLMKVAFEDIIDFKKVTEGMKLNTKLLKLSFQYMNFDEEMHGTSVGRVLADSRSVRELDVTHVTFDYRTFYDMCQAILNERCRLNILKMRGILIGEIEGKIIQFILMKNKQIHTLDLSECKTEDPSHFDYFFEKMNQFCNIRYLTLEKMQPDLSQNIECLGEALADNVKLEVLILRDNRIKWLPYQNFWTAMLPNRSLQKVNLQRTDLTDRVVEKLAKYLEQEDIALCELDVSKNQVTDAGLKSLSTSLMTNTSVKFINFGQNRIKEDFAEFVELLKVNTTVCEVSFGGNIISNEGVAALSEFLEHNTTLRHLDLSRNAFNDSGFDVFARALAKNAGITFLDIAKNKEVTDEGSLIALCEALTANEKLQTLDLSGLSIRKPFLKQSFDPALKRNITLQEVIGKIPSNIIQPELEQNVLIEREILPLYHPKYRAGPGTFNLGLVEEDPENHSRLDLRAQPQRLLKAAFKLIRNYDIRAVDFTGAGISDDTLRMLSLYLRSDPNLRSIVLDNNNFSDDGLLRLTTELNNNTKLAHLSIKGCINITDAGLQLLCDVISTTNTCLFQVDLDVDQFDKELALEVINESALNRDIQEKLKPMRTTTTVAPSGEILKVVTGSIIYDEGIDLDSESSDEQEEKVLPPPIEMDDKNMSRTSLHSHGNTETTDASVQAKNFTAMKGSSRLSIGESLNRQPTAFTNKSGHMVDESQCKIYVEVKFDPKAKIGDCFQSALKAWRIYQPNKIVAENQNLTDDHVDELVEFLKDREMITNLNLRRNLIGNVGAHCLGQFISEYDHTLTQLDVTRNRIGQEGGQALLDALNITTRMTDCQIKYGNPISNKMGRIIDREIKANIQADTYLTENKSQKGLKYEVIDKGPDYMRCAIKMAQLQNILHLSLPDNMLALDDARMISDLVKRDTPLRKLNLSTNQLDADCAAVLADSLIYNTNLQLLDVSKNLLGDFGVFLLLTPLVRKHLQANDIVSKLTPVIREKELLVGKNVKSSKRIFKPIQIMSQLQYLSIEENMTTYEAYKQVWLLLETDNQISVKIEHPNTMKARDNLSIFSSAEPATLAIEAMPLGQSIKMDNMNESQKELLNAATPGSDFVQHKIGEREENYPGADEELSESLDEEALLELERQTIEKEKARILAEKKEKAFQKKLRRVVCCQKLSCFKDEMEEFDHEDKMPSYTQICCWRFLRARRLSTKFYTGPITLKNLEKSKFTSCVSVLISINYLMLYAICIVPIILTIMKEDVETIEIDGKVVDCSVDQATCDAKEEENRDSFNSFVLMVNGAVLVYSMLCELVVVCATLKATDTRCNTYLLCQMLTGLTMRAVLLISAQLIAVFVQEIDIVNFVLGVVLASTLVLSQIRAFQIWLASIKKDKTCLQPKVNQNFRICMSTNYLAAATLYKKVSVEASDAAIAQTQAMEAERARLMSFSFADEEASGKKSRKGQNVKAKLAKCKCCRWTSPKFYQLTMNDVPLLVCLPFAYVFELVDDVNAVVMVALTLLDLICMFFYLAYEEELSIDAEKVFDMTVKRLSANEEVVEKLFDENFSVGEIELNSDDVEDLDRGSGSDEGSINVSDVDDEDGERLVHNEEPTILLSETKKPAGGPISARGDGSARVDRNNNLSTAGLPTLGGAEQQDDPVVNDIVSSSTRKEPANLSDTAHTIISPRPL